MTVRLSARGISARYGATTVLEDVSLDLLGSEVRVLLGANGAGKSSLLRVLSGSLRPVRGELTLDGQRFDPRSTREARHAGVVIVPQEPAIVAELSVEANVNLGAERSRLGFVRRRQQEDGARAALARLGRSNIDLRMRGCELSLADRHVVAIARALTRAPKVVVLDEPTSALDDSDAAHVITCVRELARQGIAVLYVTHFLDEVPRIGDTFTVLSNGRVSASGAVAKTTNAEIADFVCGSREPRVSPSTDRDLGDVVLAINGLHGVESPRGADLFVRRGEIVGLFGLDGSGRSSLLRAVLGADVRVRGTVRVEGSAPLSPGARHGVRAGLALMPEDRTCNVFPGLSVADQVTITRPDTCFMGMFSRPRRECVAAREALRAVHALDVDPTRSIDELSGGSQQKAALARLVHQDPSVMLLDEPMRGLDFHSVLEVESLLRRFADGGRSILLASSDEDELFRLCDTIAVMRKGRLVDVRAAAAWTHGDLARAAAGVEDPT